MGDQPVAKVATTQHKHNRRTSMPSAGIEPEIPIIKRPQTYVLSRTATGIGHCIVQKVKHNGLAKFLLVGGLMETFN